MSMLSRHCAIYVGNKILLNIITVFRKPNSFNVLPVVKEIKVLHKKF